MPADTLQQSHKFSHRNEEVSGFLSTSVGPLIHKNCKREFLLTIWFLTHWFNVTGDLKNSKRGQVTDTGLYPCLQTSKVVCLRAVSLPTDMESHVYGLYPCLQTSKVVCLRAVSLPMDIKSHVSTSNAVLLHIYYGISNP
jgi:hypothetical protein